MYLLIMSEIRNLTRNGETFYPLTHEKAVIGMEDFKDTITEQIDNYRPIEITGDVVNAPDEEDITSDSNNLLKFKNRNNLYGLGKVILRRGSSFSSQVTQANTIYVIQYNFDLDSGRVNIPNGSILMFEGGTLSNGTLVCADLYDVRLVYYQDISVILNSVTLEGNFIHKACDKDTIREILVDNSSITKDVNDVLSVKANGIQNIHLNSNVVDNSSIGLDTNNKISIKDGGVTGSKLNSGIVNTDDLSISNNKIQLANRGTANGMGKIILRKDQSFASQLTQQNTIYVIRYDFTLTSDVTIPTNCVLEFDGGSINGDGTNKNTITGQKTSFITSISKIFNGIILDGSWEGEYLYMEYFGVVPNDNTLATNNSTIINNYLIPSLENTKLTWKTIAEKKYYYNLPIVASGEFNIILDGYLIYDGSTTSTALIIGRQNSTSSHKQYKIKLVSTYTQNRRLPYSKTGDTWNIPEFYGLVCYNLEKCNVEIVEVAGFAKEVTLIANGGPFGGNIININSIGYEYYYGLKLLAQNNGWINENLFIGGLIVDWFSDSDLRTDGQKRAIIIEGGDGIYHSNANMFIKPACENSSVCVTLKNARENLFLGIRIEASDKALELSGSNNYNNKLIYTQNFGTETKSIDNNRVGDYSSILPSSPIKTINLYKYKINEWFWRTNCICALHEGTDNPASGYSSDFFGVKVKTDTAKIISAACPDGGRWGVLLYDENGNRITSNIMSHVLNVNGYLNGSYIIPHTQTSTGLSITVTDDVKSIFIGFQSVDGEITIYSYPRVDNIVIDTYEYSKTTPNTPIANTSNIPVGEVLIRTSDNKPIYYIGNNTWVDATGA